mmetsp:Transcript_102365/g.298462  ORF Transcript_102365/g.298462 Transcript_102365/m.298462 type:complete len:278 (+) Transcript_102365:43-876(+)
MPRASASALLLVLLLAALPPVPAHRVLDSAEEAADAGAGAGIPPVPNVRTLRLGDKGEALVPALQVPEGLVYHFMVQKRSQESGEIDYRWELKDIEFDKRKDAVFDTDLIVASLGCTSASCSHGHKSFRVKDNSGKEVFKLRMSRSVYNVAGRRKSFRILPPRSKENADALFTINKDVYGRGGLMLRNEWRIYRGRERDGDEAYYCVSAHFDLEWKVYKSQHAYERYEYPIATIKQVPITDAAPSASPPLRDTFKVSIQHGEDSALILSLTTLLDVR